MRCVSWHGFNKLGGQNKGMSEQELHILYEAKVKQLLEEASKNPRDEGLVSATREECVALDRQIQQMRRNQRIVSLLTQECRKTNGMN